MSLQKNHSTVISSGGIIRPSASANAKRDIAKFEILQSSPAPATIGGGFGEGEFMSCQVCARKAWVAVVVLGWALAGFALPATAQKQAEAKNMNLVGYNDLQGRSAYQPSIHKQCNRC